jgi:tetratricopeptide (TPR) repeat protein
MIGGPAASRGRLGDVPIMSLRIALTLLALVAAAGTAWARRGGDDAACANTPEPEKAVAACTRLYENEGLGRRNRAIALGNRAAAQKQLGRYDEAVADLAEAIELDSGNPQYYSQRGDILVRQSKFKEAIDDYSGALSKRPGFAWALAGRGKARLSEGDAAGAIDDFTQGLRKTPGDLRMQLWRGRANTQAKDYEAAVKDLTGALRSKGPPKLLPGERAVILSQRAFALLKLKRTSEARPDVEEALQLAPKNAFSIAMLGLVEEQSGHKAEAKDAYARALAIEPKLEFAKIGQERLEQDRTVTGATPVPPATQGKTTAALPATAAPPPAAAPAAPAPVARPAPAAASTAETLCARYVPQTGTTVLVECGR